MKQKEQKTYGGLKNQHIFFVYDGGGLFLEFALQLGRDGHKVYYYSPFYDSELSFKRYALGFGFELIEKPLYFWTALMKYPKEEVTIMFPDVGNGDMAEFLKRQGYAVFAAGRGDILENHRELLRKKTKEVGLPIAPYVEIVGLENLENFLKKKENLPRVVKLDIFRNDRESFKVEDFNDVEQILVALELKFGHLSDGFPFIVEEIIEGEEPGFDILFNKTDYLAPYLWGFEVSKGPYCGTVSNVLPKPLQFVVDKLKPLLTQYDWRGFVSIEAIINNNKPYLIDVCARSPYPLGVGYTVLYSNFSEIVYKVARGITVIPRVRGKYMIILPLLKEVYKEDLPMWNNIKVPFTGMIEKDNNYYAINLSGVAKKGKQLIGLPGYETHLVITGVGNDSNVLAKEILDIAKKCKTNGVSFNYDEKGLLVAVEKVSKLAKS
jgi:hypothetical protein